VLLWPIPKIIHVTRIEDYRKNSLCGTRIGRYLVRKKEIWRNLIIRNRFFASSVFLLLFAHPFEEKDESVDFTSCFLQSLQGIFVETPQLFEFDSLATELGEHFGKDARVTLNGAPVVA
jgi:hypothetical protein